MAEPLPQLLAVRGRGDVGFITGEVLRNLRRQYVFYEANGKPLAALSQDQGLVRHFVSRAVEEDAPVRRGWTALHILAGNQYSWRPKMIDMVCKAGAEVDALRGGAQGKTAFMMAVGTGVTDGALALHHAGASAHLADAQGSTAVNYAAHNTYLEGNPVSGAGRLPA